MKAVLLSISILLTTFAMAQNHSIYDYEIETIDGKTISMSQFKGKKIMIVNTASKCGFTPQYEQLQALYAEYKDQNFVIIGFPANDFLKQEPGSNEEIAAFCQKNYGVDFPMMAKISVKGKEMAPIYEWLTSKELNGKADSSVKWNFQKYLIGTDGKLEEMYYSKVTPNDAVIIDWIKKK